MRVVVIGASAGGVESLKAVAANLSPGFPAPIVVVLHMPADERSLLAAILQKAGALTATQAQDGETLEPGCIYVARPDHHVLVEPGRLKVTRGPRENRMRPAVDPLFRSAAAAYGPGVIGVVLSGS